MKIKTLLMITGVLSALYAAALLVMPESFLEMRGASTDSYGIVMCRLMGAAVVGFAILGIKAGRSESAEVWKLGAQINCASWAVGFVVLLMAKMSLEYNMMIWVDIGFAFIFTVSCGYYLFMKPKQ